jgi:hypothetical protein
MGGDGGRHDVPFLEGGTARGDACGLGGVALGNVVPVVHALDAPSGTLCITLPPESREDFGASSNVRARGPAETRRWESNPAPKQRGLR